MDFTDILKTRYSVRKYQNKPVEKEKLIKILESARVAPTAHNNQPFKILVIDEEDSFLKLEKAARVYGAKLALVVCCNHQESWKRSYDGMDAAIIDATIVTDHMMLQATDLGLSTLWICHFNPQILKDEFGIKEPYEPVNILLVGYSDGTQPVEDRHTTRRKVLEDILMK